MNCSTDHLQKETAILTWNSTKKGNKGSYGKDTDINHGVIPEDLQSNKISLKDSKTALRKLFLSRRKAHSAEFIQNSSRKICERFIGLPAIKNAENIAFYFPINNEVDTTGLFDVVSSSNKSCYFPKVTAGGLVFHKISSPGELEEGAYGVPEPVGSAPAADINEIDIFIVPGLCFDEYGTRLGYGKGYYDKALMNISSSKIYGFCYSYQVVNDVPSDKKDKRVGHLVCENKLISCKNLKGG